MVCILMTITVQCFSQFEIIKTTDGCKFYDFPKYFDNESYTWSGKCINGFINGNGELKAKTSDGILLKYKGEMLNGKKNGT